MEFSIVKRTDINYSDSQPRQVFDKKEIAQMAKSMGTRGFRGAVKINKKGMVLIGGARRLAAAEIAKITDIPALIFDDIKDEKSLFMEQIADNSNRVNLTLQETLDAYTRGIELGSTTGELAALLGKTEASVKKELAWLSLPKDVIKAVDTGSFPRAGLAEIVKFPANKVEKAFAKAAKGTNVKEISGILKNYSKDLSESKKKKAELKKETPTAAEKRETKAANTKKRQAWTTAHAKITGFENLPTAFGKADIGKFADELKASAKILQDMIVEMEARKAELK